MKKDYKNTKIHWIYICNLVDIIYNGSMGGQLTPFDGTQAESPRKSNPVP
jgi:hypothetical protein